MAYQQGSDRDLYINVNDDDDDDDDEVEAMYRRPTKVIDQDVQDVNMNQNNENGMNMGRGLPLPEEPGETDEEMYGPQDGVNETGTERDESFKL